MTASDHHHDHDHAGMSERRLLWAFVLTILTLVVEAAGGWISGSLALLADAGHMFVDAFALLLAWMGAYFARRPADDKRSFGYARLEVLVGYTNALFQFVLVAWIVIEAMGRFAQPEPILSGTMLVIAIASLVVNLFVLRVLGGHDHDDLNAAGARLHVIGDLLGSLGAVAAALLIRWKGWLWADPAFSIFVSLLIVRSAWKLLKRSAHILLEGTPEGIDTAQVAVAARAGEGVVDVHHVHVWQLAGGRRLATLHARLAEEADAHVALAQVQRILREKFQIVHATVQIERRDCAHEDCTRGKHDHEHDNDHDHEHGHDHAHTH
ncbi:MAG: cation transporter [Rudaea sp.]|uniref:cation diffusion facilitator family transporter n=1 Tax=unclassified Rudaea TaxID=2627037 RepID=UPI0010F6FECA|nr:MULTISPECIES: cation diffusion facilitator family transporter [unclassified Rudaea]MBN8884302.1 cation transporter [Rudaea sp.]MBR0346555.1 cation transporter [Rudaea sp.]